MISHDGLTMDAKDFRFPGIAAEPCRFDPKQYIAETNKKLKRRSVTIVDASFCPNGVYLIAGGDDGVVNLWNIEKCLDDDNNKEIKYLEIQPDISFAIENSINSITFTQFSSSSSSPSDGVFVVIGTDTSIQLFEFASVLECIVSGETPLSTCEYKAPTKRGSRDSTFPLPEFNQVVKNYSGDKQLIGACGDSTAHQFDVEKSCLVRSYEGHSDYLLTLSTSPDGENLLVTGANDGMIGVWDTRVKRWSSMLENNFKRFNFTSWVSSIELSHGSGNWLTCAGGLQSNGGFFGAESGFIEKVYIPSGMSTASRQTTSSINRIAQYDESVYAVGAEQRLDIWNAVTLENDCHWDIPSKNNFAIAISEAGPTKRIIAIGLSDPAEIGICLSPGVVSFTLKFGLK
mmetsp:Transcript_15882/g.22390  ORF Transcript_15882/g.22390 Transcript_15882/m.22390 type:complete len:401 (+) Transcript_15882:123-1325(+)